MAPNDLGTARIIQADSRNLPLPDNSVDLIVTSPPYFALRSYQDGGTHYAGQIGDEPTPAEFVDSLIEVTRECMRVLKPSGSLWVNLGDKYSTGSSGDSSMAKLGEQYRGGGQKQERAKVRSAPAAGFRPKTLLGIPWRYALRCIDDLGLILRAEVIWSKPNGLPESVTDRVRRSHEQWFHFVTQPRYFSAVDEIREPHAESTVAKFGPVVARREPTGDHGRSSQEHTFGGNPLGKLPGSVWTVPTEPLRVPDHLGVDHFAAFPTEWPKRIIQGWSPAGVCVECGEGRRPVAERAAAGKVSTTARGGGNAREKGMADFSHINRSEWRENVTYDITGYVCACPEPTAPTTPGQVLDVFGGTGTTAMVAKALGRDGISVDMSADYCRLAEWRCNDRDQLAKVLGIEKAEQPHRDDVPLFDLEPAERTRPSGGIGYANAKGRTCPECGYRSQRPSGCEKCGSDLGGAA